MRIIFVIIRITLDKIYKNIFIISVSSLIFLGCNPVKRLPKDEYLLNRNVIVDKSTTLEKDNITAYLQQKPNRKILGIFRFHLGIYNLVNPERMRQHKLSRDKKIDKLNVKRAAKGEKLKSKDRLTFREWLMDIGEAPVQLDCVLVEKSVNQIKLLLNSKGYFINNVRDSISIKGRKASVFYTITAERPYTIRNITYTIEDESLKPFILSDTVNCLIKKTNNYDLDILQVERARITKNLRNKGFYNFTKEYIYFDIDTNLNNRQVDVTVGIKKYAHKKQNTDSIIETLHPRFYIRNIIIEPGFNPAFPYQPLKDTLREGDYIILYNNVLEYKSKVLLDPILIKKGDLFSAKDAENTYKRLAELKAFKIITLKFRELEADNLLDCIIQLTPVIKQSFTLEGEATNSDGDLGLAGSYAYQNKNTFKGAEILQVKLKGELKAVKSNTEIQTDNNNISFFNTIEVGPEVSLSIPRPFFPFTLFDYSVNSAPKTTFTTSYNYQARPDYTRSILNLSYGFSYHETANKKHSIYPIEISSIRVGLTPSFQDGLNATNNALLISRFSDHLVTSSRYSFIFNNQAVKNDRNFSFFKFNSESSGNILRGIDNLIDWPKDSEGSYRVFNIKFSHYLRSDVDLRYYIVFNKMQRLVLRTAFGVGKPLQNLRVLPLEKSFFAGGANSMRAWRARTLGPGSYNNVQNNAYDQIGDAQIETNAEYRFNIIKMLNGAFFVDAGNIWLRKPDPARPGGDFTFERFYKEFAVGTGLGARVDFNFFILRLDLGIKMRDPQFEENERWVGRHLFDKKWKDEYLYFNAKRYNFLNINLGIGYPF
jgi:outer membrane protein assembly factor BamA